MTTHEQTMTHLTEALKHIDILLASGEHRNSGLEYLNRAKVSLEHLLPVKQWADRTCKSVWAEGKDGGNWCGKTKIKGWQDIKQDEHPFLDAIERRKGREV